VKKSEVHGMAQRGGSVTSHVRFGGKVWSPLIEEGCADLLLAMEKLEALRWSHFLKKTGKALICDLEILPMTVSTGQAQYPDVEKGLRERGVDFVMIPATQEAFALGDSRVINTILTGAASAYLTLGTDVWMEALRRRVPPKALEVNVRAFERGRQLAGV